MVIVSIQADEYIQIARENPAIFSTLRKFAMKDAKNHLFSNPICALADLIKCRYCEQ